LKVVSPTSCGGETPINLPAKVGFKVYRDRIKQLLARVVHVAVVVFVEPDRDLVGRRLPQDLRLAPLAVLEVADVDRILAPLRGGDVVGTSVFHQPDVVVVQVVNIAVPVGVVLNHEGRGYALIAETTARAASRRRVLLHNERHPVRAPVRCAEVYLSREAEVVGEVDAGLVPDGAELAARCRGQSNRASIVLPDSAEYKVGSRVGGVAVSRGDCRI